MKEYRDKDTITSEIKMLRANGFSGVFIIVEGSTDSRFFEQFIDDTSCEIIPAESDDSKKDAIGVLKILNNESFIGVIAVVDLDFDKLRGIIEIINNLFYTETHDIDTMLLKSYALDKLLIQYGSKNKISKQGDIRNILIKNGLPIGYLRWISIKNNLSLDFNGLTFSKFIDKKTLDINNKKLIEVVINNSQKHNLLVDEISKLIEGLKNLDHDPWQVCCGHDLACILALGLQSLFGTKNSNEVLPENIEKSLRLAYEFSFFKSTILYNDIINWELFNNPYRIFKNEDTKNG